jgi:hypothetical protein
MAAAMATMAATAIGIIIATDAEPAETASQPMNCPAA